MAVEQLKKDNLVQELAEITGKSKKDVLAIVDAYHGVVLAALKADKEVNLPGVGKLKPAVRLERKARNPQTGEEIIVPEKKTVRLAVSKAY